MSYTDLAKATGLSTSAAHQRVRRLEERGVIRGYAAVVDPDADRPAADRLHLGDPARPGRSGRRRRAAGADRPDRGLPLGGGRGELHPQGPGRGPGRPRGAAGPDPRGRQRPHPDDDRALHAVRSPAACALAGGSVEAPAPPRLRACHPAPCATSPSTAHDPFAQATWWAQVTGGQCRRRRLRRVTRRPASSRPRASAAPNLLFERVPEAKTIKNRVHLDLQPDTTREEEVARLRGARRHACRPQPRPARRRRLGRAGRPRGQRVLRRAQPRRTHLAPRDSSLR